MRIDSNQSIRTAGSGIGKVKRILLFLIMIAGLIFSAMASNQEMEVLGHNDYGTTYDVAQSGNFLYVAAGEQVRIYNISSSSQLSALAPTVIDTYAHNSLYQTITETQPDLIIHTGGKIKRMLVDGNYLYAATSTNLTIVDITTPLSSTILTNISGAKYDITMNGNTAFITGASYIYAYNFSNKSAPTLISSIAMNLPTSYPPKGINYSANYLYVATGGNRGLDIYDVSNSSNMSRIGAYNVSNDASRASYSSVKVSGNYAYVIEYHKGLRVLDISDPTVPVQVAYFLNNANAYNYNDIKLVGNYAYISERYYGVNIVDISSPTTVNASSRIGRLDSSSGYAEGIFPASLSYGDYVFMSTDTQGVQIINSTVKTSMSLMSVIGYGVDGDSIAVLGNYAYVGGHNVGIFVFNISDPSNVIDVALVKTGGRTTGLTIKDNTLFASGNWNPLTAINITDPENPVILDSKRSDRGCGSASSYANYSYCRNIQGPIITVDNYLYNADMIYDCFANGTCSSTGIHNFTIFDISNESDIRLINNTNLGMGFGAFCSARYGDNYLMCGSQTGMYIVNITDRTHPQIESTTAINLYSKEINVSGDTAYITRGSYLDTYNISDVTAPSLLGSIKLSSPAGVATYQNISYAFPREAIYKFYAVDVANPSALYILDNLTIGGNTYEGRIIEKNGTLYSASGYIIEPVAFPPFYMTSKHS